MLLLEQKRMQRWLKKSIGRQDSVFNRNVINYIPVMLVSVQEMRVRLELLFLIYNPSSRLTFSPHARRTESSSDIEYISASTTQVACVKSDLQLGRLRIHFGWGGSRRKTLLSSFRDGNESAQAIHLFWQENLLKANAEDKQLVFQRQQILNRPTSSPLEIAVQSLCITQNEVILINKILSRICLEWNNCNVFVSHEWRLLSVK